MALEELTLEELRAKAAELGVPSAFRNRKQLSAAVEAAMGAAKDAAPAVVEAVVEKKKKYRLTPRNGVSVILGGRYAVSAGGETVEEGHPLINQFDYYISTEEIKEQ